MELAKIPVFVFLSMPRIIIIRVCVKIFVMARFIRTNIHHHYHYRQGLFPMVIFKSGITIIPYS